MGGLFLCLPVLLCVFCCGAVVVVVDSGGGGGGGVGLLNCSL